MSYAMGTEARKRKVHKLEAEDHGRYEYAWLACRDVERWNEGPSDGRKYLWEPDMGQGDMPTLPSPRQAEVRAPTDLWISTLTPLDNTPQKKISLTPTPVT